jgi:crotonobetaine/carnitine-CoA ligase
VPEETSYASIFPGAGASLFGILASQTARDRDAPLITFLGGGTWTRGEVFDGAMSTADLLSRLGVGRGDRVCSILGNRIEFIHALFASARLGAVFVPINTAQKGETLAHMVLSSEPSVIFFEATFRQELETITREGGISPALVSTSPECGGTTALDRAVGPGGASWLVVAGKLRPPEEGGDLTAVNGRDLAAILYTSGTTGPSKGVMWSHRMGLYNSYISSLVMDYREEDVLFTALPLFHINALFTSFVAGLMVGARVVVAERFSASQFWEQIRDSGATVTSILGSMAHILLRQPSAPAESEHKLRLALVIPSVGETQPEFEARFHLKCTEIYGSTDMSLPLGIPHGVTSPLGSCGIVLPGWECRIVDEEEEEVAGGTSGELLVRPALPWIGQMGYWKMPEATLEAWQNLWFHTGDRMRRDGNGWHYYMGRLKDSIRRTGENVSAFEVERCVLRFPGVGDAAVFGVPSDLGEEDVAVVIVPAEGASLILEDLRRYLEERLPFFAVPRYFGQRSDLPRTTTEKVRKDLLAAGEAFGDLVDLGRLRSSRS